MKKSRKINKSKIDRTKKKITILENSQKKIN